MALQRGPIIYCAEWVDNGGKTSNIIIPSDAVFSSTYEPGLLNGVEVLNSKVPVIVVDDKGQQVSTVERKFTAIPYYAWANRGKGEMMVWFPVKISDIDLLTNRPDANTVSK